jgi:hypothetical protein
MLTIFGSKQRLCDGVSRRDFLRVGGLTVGGLTLADLLRLKAQGASAGESGKAVIMVYLNGGPSHVDLYDMKPDAPVEIRGDFKPIRTNVSGFDICELMPLQATIADKLAIIRSMKFEQQGHTPPELFTGFLKGNRPSIGSVVSKLRADAGVRNGMPPYVYLGDANYVGAPGFLGKAHEAYIPGGKAANLGRPRELTLDQLDDRRKLLKSFDGLRRELDDARGSLEGMDAFTAQAMEMIASNKARDAFDVSKEPEAVREKYGKGVEFLQARRLVEAGVPVVTLTPRNHNPGPMCNGEWDHHDHIFRCLRAVVPQFDRSIHALITDLEQRGLYKNVVVVVWGEMGRTPRVGTQRGTTAGRDHWPQAGFCLVAGGGLQMGQVIGSTDPRGERPKGRPYTPQNVLATIYHVLGIDPVSTLPDHQGRPVYLLDDREPVAELI